jgi:integrase
MRSIHRLSDRQVKNSKPGLRCDGAGLYLQTTQGTIGLTRSWLFRYLSPATGKERMAGLGSYPLVSLAAARQKAADARSQLAQRIDPIAAKHAARASQVAASTRALTFDGCLDAYEAAHQGEWCQRYAMDWVRSVRRYACPTIGKLLPSMVDVTLALKVLEPIWAKRPVMAPQVRQRCEAIWSWARARDLCSGENPFAWERLKHLLASPAKTHTVENHPAMPYAELPAFLVELQACNGTAAQALRFTILTAARTGETLGAPWDEFDLANRVWTIPAERMKGGLEHRVPLSGAAMRILEQQAKVRESNLVFGLSHSAMGALLARMDQKITVHGFRSSFKDWAVEQTDFPDWVSEKALAHKVGDETRRAYQRSDLLEKRRQLMDEWAAFCEGATL